MSRILIFGGTTEGRLLAQALSQRHIPAAVSVATVLGAQELSGLPGITPLVGRRTAEEMAVLLADFTQNASALLAGVDVGGLGTPVASLASLISLKLYLRTPEAQPKRYLGVFLGLNFAFLIVLYGLSVLLTGSF